MAHNFYIKCPICNSVTRVRTIIGYNPKTPVRIPCGKCKTIMSGTFIIRPQTGECGFIPENCASISIVNNYQYYCEVLSEFPGLKSVVKPEADAPMMRVSVPNAVDASQYLWSMSTDYDESISRLKQYSNFFCHMIELKDNWSEEKIPFDLFRRKQFELITQNYQNDALKYGLSLSTEFEIAEYIWSSYFFHFNAIFTKTEFNVLLSDTYHYFSELEPNKLTQFIDKWIRPNNRVEKIQNKLFDIAFDYVQIAANLFPALGSLRMKDKDIDLEQKGISTCTLEDIKTFHQDSFERLADCIDLPVGLNNIIERKNHNLCPPLEYSAEDTRKKVPTSIKSMMQIRKGYRIKNLNAEEPFGMIVNLNIASNKTRNPIGHTEYEFDPISQHILFWPENPEDNQIELYLLELAQECVRQMQSSVALATILYLLIRYANRKEYQNIPLYPSFYSHVRSQSRCLCGSGKKYSACCKKSKRLVSKLAYKLPNRCDFTLPLTNLQNDLKNMYQ